MREANVFYINGRFLAQPLTGVQRYAQEIVTATDGLLGAGELPLAPGQVVLVVPATGVQRTLPLQHIRAITGGKATGHRWEQLELPGLVGENGALVNLGNTAPLPLLLRGRCHVTVHDVSWKLYPEAFSKPFLWFYRFLIPMVMRHAFGMVTDSHAERENILRHFPKAAPRLTALSLGTSALPEPDGTGIPDAAVAQPFLLYVGSPNGRKNLPTLFRAFAEVAADIPLALVLVGGDAESYQRQIAQHIPAGLRDRVHYLGRVDDAGVAFLYRRAFALAYLSFYEGSGLPLTEAMSLGCPVLASDIPVHRERCGEAAVYASPHSSAAVAAAVLALWRDGPLQERLKEAGQEQAARFTWRDTALALWHDVLAKAPR